MAGRPRKNNVSMEEMIKHQKLMQSSWRRQSVKSGMRSVVKH